MPKYKVWVEIEEHLIEGDPYDDNCTEEWQEYETVGDPEEICEFDTLEEAEEIVEKIRALALMERLVSEREEDERK